MKTILLILAVGFSFNSFSQSVSFQEVDGATTKPKGKFDSYVSKDSTTYSVGDKITIGQPSGANGKFVYLQEMTVMGDMLVVGAKSANTKTEIKKIKVTGTKRSGFKVNIQSKGMTGVSNYFFPLEDAISAGEITPK